MLLQIAEAHSSVFKVYPPPNHIRNPDKYYVFERSIPAFGAKRPRVQIPPLRPEKAGNRKVSGSFFVSFAQGAVFGAFFMQRMCNLGERAKDRVLYWAVDLADSWSPGPKCRILNESRRQISCAELATLLLSQNFLIQNACTFGKFGL